MEQLLEILSEIKEDVDFTTCTTLIDDGILDSFDILQIISALNEAYDISIPASEIMPQNFNSAESFTRWWSACRKIDGKRLHLSGTYCIILKADRG